MAETYVYNGAGYERVSWTVSTYDGKGHVMQTVRHNGQFLTAVWTGDRQTSGIDESGIETPYTYDTLGRLRTSTKKGIVAGGAFPAQADLVTTTVYDAEGRLREESVSGGGPGTGKTNTYDPAGRLSTSTDEAGLITSYSYQNGGRTQTVTRPGGATEIHDRYFDGQSKSVTGSGVVATYFNYDVNADGTRWTQNFVGPAGLNSPRWIKTTTDWSGREIKVEKPTFTGTNLIESSIYNTLGQLQKQTTTAGATKLIADKLFEYDELGRQIRVGSDTDANGTLSLASTDRISETDSIYQKVGSDWFLVNTNKSYFTDNNSTPTIQVHRERLNNFALNGTDQTISESTVTDVAGNSTITTTTIDRAAKKLVTTEDTPASNVNGVSIVVNGLLQLSVPNTPQLAITYLYDSIGRLISIIDPRSGTSTRSYSATTGQLTATNDGAGNTQFDYYPATHANAGRLRVQTNAAGKKIYFSYSSRGELVQTWGDATYPLEYLYDSYGQRTELHTFRGGQNWAASNWPSSTMGTPDVTKWIYQEATGLLTQKQDAALRGPVYSRGKMMSKRRFAFGDIFLSSGRRNSSAGASRFA